ncbi:MAG: ABC transporter permease, partial [Mesorhizobium sp.]
MRRPPLACRPSPPQGGRSALTSAFAKLAPAALAFALLLLAWELYARLGGLAPTVVPAPSRVLAQAWENRAALAETTLPTI